MIVTGAYFVGELYLSQVTPETASKHTNNKLKNEYFINEYEREILESGLGYGMLKEFYTHINESNGLIKEDSVDTVWDELLNGKEYQKGDKRYYWSGLVEKQGLLNRSMMAYYVYFRYLNDQTRQNTARGTSTGGKKEKKASVMPSTTGAWRKLVKWYGGDECGINPSISYKRGITFVDYYQNNNSGRVSLYQFLSDNKDDYPKWQFTSLGDNLNRFGI